MYTNKHSIHFRLASLIGTDSPTSSTKPLQLHEVVQASLPSAHNMGKCCTNRSTNTRPIHNRLQRLAVVGSLVTVHGSTQETATNSLQSWFLLSHSTGTPSIPDTPTAVGNGPLAQVMLRTGEAGVGDPPPSFRFILQVYRLNSSDSGTDFVREVEEGLVYPEYESGDIVVANVEGLELGREYQFAAQAANVFGTSQVSNLSNPVLLNLSGEFLKLCLPLKLISSVAFFPHSLTCVHIAHTCVASLASRGQLLSACDCASVAKVLVWTYEVLTL